MLDTPVVTDEVPAGREVAIFGLGCFWGAEEIYWQVPGVWSTSVGYAGGVTPAPDVRGGVQRPHRPHRGRPGRLRPRGRLLRRPGQAVLRGARPDPGDRQGNDVGTQYRSAIYFTTPEQEQTARELTTVYGDELARRRLGEITTEVRPAARAPYFYAEDAHQQYLAKNPFGYRCHANTGVRFPA